LSVTKRRCPAAREKKWQSGFVDYRRDRFCLPGSTGACRTAWDRLIRDQLDSRNRPCNLVEMLPRLIEP
jgi:molybdopterin biosynthesis enzyme MoaB